MTFLKLLNKMDLDKTSFQKAEGKLLSRKEELIISGNTSKWELSHEDQNMKFDINKDKALILSKILPKVRILNLNQGHINC